jgi:CheY-like chemotaxis protein
MPVMDGWEFLQAYQNLQCNQKGKIIIVMLTTSFNPDDKTKSLKYKEISGYKNKPLSSEILDEIMLKYFADYL